MAIKISSVLLVLQCLFASSYQQVLNLRSPCPRIFRYEKDAEENRWNGILLLNDRVDVDGIWIRLTMSEPIDVMTSEFGLPRTKNNKDYIIVNDEYSLPANVMKFVRFRVKYKSADSVPIVTDIRLNGRLICPKKPKTSTNAFF